MKVPQPDKQKIDAYVEQYNILTMPDHDLTEKYLEELKIHSIIDLEITLNSYSHDERLAAIKMVGRYMDDLLSGDFEKWKAARDELAEIYYKVSETDEEAIL